MTTDPAPRMAVLAGTAAACAGMAANLAGILARPHTLSLILFLAAGCGWAASALGWRMAAQGRNQAWPLILAALAVACLSPLHLALMRALAEPELMPDLAASGLLAWVLASPLLVFADLYVLAQIRAARRPRSALFSGLSMALRPALIVLLFFAVPGVGRIVHRDLANSPVRVMEARLETLALELELRSQSNAVICDSDPASPHCRRVASCVEALALARSETPTGVLALRDHSLDPSDRAAACLLLDPATDARVRFQAQLRP